MDRDDGKGVLSVYKAARKPSSLLYEAGNALCPEDDILYIEASLEQYRAWRQEQNAHYYLTKTNKPYTQLSLDAARLEDDTYTLYDVLADTASEVEPKILQEEEKDILFTAIDTLTPLEREAIMQAFFSDSERTDQEISAAMGMARTTFSDRKNRALKKLKKYFEE